MEAWRRNCGRPRAGDAAVLEARGMQIDEQTSSVAVKLPPPRPRNGERTD
jgi:hypothetical protein